MTRAIIQKLVLPVSSGNNKSTPPKWRRAFIWFSCLELAYHISLLISDQAESDCERSGFEKTLSAESTVTDLAYLSPKVGLLAFRLKFGPEKALAFVHFFMQSC